MSQHTSTEIQPGEMLDGFISYSRRDSEFVQALREELEQAGKRCWLDQRQLMPSTEWMQEIYRAIEASDHFIFILSPSSLESEICGLELNYALELSKQLVIVQHGEVDMSLVSPELSRLHWINPQPIKTATLLAAEVIQAMSLNPDWLRYHTELLVKAVEWQRGSRDSNLLLRGEPLRQASSELSNSNSERKPLLNQLQHDYIAAGVAAANSRRRLTLVSTAVISLIVASLLIWAAQERSTGESQRAIAEARQSAQQAIALFQQPDSAIIGSAMLATESMQALQQLGSNDPELIASLRGIVSLLPDSIGEARLEEDLSVIKYDNTGQLVAINSDGNIAKLNEQGEVQEIVSVDYEVLDFAVSSEGAFITAAITNGIAEIRQEPGSRLLASLQHDNEPEAPGQSYLNPEFSHEIQTVSLNNGGSHVVTGGLSSARMWRIADATELTRVVLPGTGIEELAFSPDTQSSEQWAVARTMWYIGRLSSNGENSIVNSQQMALTGPIAISSRGYFIAVQEPGNIVEPRVTVFDIRNIPPVPWEIDSLRTQAVNFKPNSEQLAAVTGTGVRLFDVIRKIELGRIEEDSTIVNLAINDSGEITLLVSGTISRWRSPGSLGVGSLSRVAIEELIFHPEGNPIIGHNGSWVTVFESQQIRRLDTKPGIQQLALSPDGSLLASRHSQFVDIYDLQNRELLLTLPAGDGQFMTTMAFGPDSNRIATGEHGGNIKIWGSRDGGRILRINSAERVGALEFGDSADQLLSASGQQAVLRNLAQREILLQMKHQANITHIRAANDGAFGIIASDDGKFCRWQKSFDNAQWCSELDSEMSYMQLSSDNRFLATLNGKEVAQLWNTTDGSLEFQLPHKSVSDLDFVPRSGLVAATDGNLVRVWDLSRKTELARFAHEGRVATVRFSPDGHLLASGGTFGAQLWHWHPEDLLRETCNLLSDINVLNASAEKDLNNRLIKACFSD